MHFDDYIINELDYSYFSYGYRLFKYQYAPYEFYYERNKEKFNDESSLHLNKVKARKHYSQLEDQDKLVYIKKCEKAFDHYEVIFTL